MFLTASAFENRFFLSSQVTAPRWAARVENANFNDNHHIIWPSLISMMGERPSNEYDKMFLLRPLCTLPRHR